MTEIKKQSKPKKENNLVILNKYLNEILVDGAPLGNFWYQNAMWGDINGIIPLSRITFSIVNERGFNPLERKTEEKFAQFCVIDFGENKNNKNYAAFYQKRTELELKSILYIKSNSFKEILESLLKKI